MSDDGEKGVQAMCGLAVLIGAAAIAGCANANTSGPFVTNIRSAGEGKIQVERCKVKADEESGGLSMVECTSDTVVVSGPAPPSRP